MVGFHLGKLDVDYLSVNVTGRPHPDRDDRDVNWLSAEVEVRAGGFAGRFGTRFLVGELQVLREQLARLHSFELREGGLAAADGQLAIGIEGDGLGNFTAECAASNADGNELTFTLLFDQTEIPAFLKGLDAVLAEYPFIKFKGCG